MDKKIVDFADIKDRAKSVDLNKVDKNAWMYDKNMKKTSEVRKMDIEENVKNVVCGQSL